MEAKISGENRASFFESVAAEVAKSSTESEEGSVPNWCLKEEVQLAGSPRRHQFSKRVIRRGNDVLRSSHLQSIIRTVFGREKFGAGIEAFRRWIFDALGEFPPVFW